MSVLDEDLKAAKAQLNFFKKNLVAEGFFDNTKSDFAYLMQAVLTEGDESDRKDFEKAARYLYGISAGVVKHYDLIEEDVEEDEEEDWLFEKTKEAMGERDALIVFSGYHIGSLIDIDEEGYHDMMREIEAEFEQKGEG